MAKTPEIDAVKAIQKAGDDMDLALQILQEQKRIAREDIKQEYIIRAFLEKQFRENPEVCGTCIGKLLEQVNLEALQDNK